MKMIEKLLVIKQSGHEGRFPLSYVTHNGKTNLENRLSTGRVWAGNREVYEFVNDFISGIQIVGVASRYETSNKVMEVQDPRGFTFQIYMENFFNLLKYTEIKNGRIISAVKYVLDNNNNIALISINDINFDNVQKTMIDKKDLNYTDFKADSKKSAIKYGEIIDVKNSFYEPGKENVDEFHPNIFLGKFVRGKKKVYILRSAKWFKEDEPYKGLKNSDDTFDTCLDFGGSFKYKKSTQKYSIDLSGFSIQEHFSIPRRTYRVGRLIPEDKNLSHTSIVFKNGKFYLVCWKWENNYSHKNTKEYELEYESCEN